MVELLERALSAYRVSGEFLSRDFLRAEGIGGQEAMDNLWPVLAAGLRNVRAHAYAVTDRNTEMTS